MDINTLIKDLLKRKWVLFLVATVFILVILCGFIGYPSLVSFTWNTIDVYLTFIERIADKLLQLVGSEMHIINHKVFIGTEIITTINNQYLLKKWVLFLIVLFWITPTVHNHHQTLSFFL